jgi:hypothetical protein
MYANKLFPKQRNHIFIQGNIGHIWLKHFSFIKDKRKMLTIAETTDLSVDPINEHASSITL